MIAPPTALPQPTHLGELFAILQRRLRPDGAGDAGLDLRLTRYRGDRIEGRFRDPHDGRLYALAITPLADAGQTCPDP